MNDDRSSQPIGTIDLLGATGARGGDQYARGVVLRAIDRTAHHERQHEAIVTMVAARCAVLEPRHSGRARRFTDDC